MIIYRTTHDSMLGPPPRYSITTFAVYYYSAHDTLLQLSAFHCKHSESRDCAFFFFLFVIHRSPIMYNPLWELVMSIK